MIIGIDASRYGHSESTGVENYSREIIDRIVELSGKKPDTELRLYCKEDLGLGAQQKIIEAKRLWTLKALSKEMGSNAPDVLFVPSHVLPLKLPRKSVITIHDVAFRHLRSAYSAKQYHYLNWSTKFAVKNASSIIVPSEATKQDLIELFHCPASKIHVVYHGYSAPSYTQSEVDKVLQESEVFKYFGIHKKSKYFLFVGRIETKKNLENLLEAFAKFSKQMSEYRLVLAGKRGEGANDVIKKVNDLQLADRVIMPGYVTNVEKAALFQYCQALMFPSLYEGFGLPILEAFYYKKPVLTSDVSCLPEIAGNAAYFVSPDSVEQIAEGMHTLARNKEHCEILVSRGTKRLADFSWDQAAQKTLEIICG